MPASVLSAHALTKTYAAGDVSVHALRGLDLEISAGEVIVLLGPSGSGKSTLLNIMGGLDHATSGKAYFKDLEVTGLDDRGLTAYRRRHVGFVFQFYNLIPSLTAYENVALVTEIADRPMQPDEALALVGLMPRMNHFPAQLSGGEQQRVAIARAIAKRPDVLLCDEPTGALGIQDRHQGDRGVTERQLRARHHDAHHHSQRRHPGRRRPRAVLCRRPNFGDSQERDAPGGDRARLVMPCARSTSSSSATSCGSGPRLSPSRS